MIILDLNDVQELASVSTPAGPKEFLQYQDHYYTFHKKCYTTEQANLVCNLNLRQGNPSLILVRQQPEVWIRVSKEKVTQYLRQRSLKQLTTVPPGGKSTTTKGLNATISKPLAGYRPLVIYIDDSEMDGMRMSTMIRALGCDCLHVQNPVLALPTLLEKKPSLVLLDLVMPVASGYEVCAQIRRINQFKDMPIIIVTSSDGVVDRARAKLVGSSGFVAKPAQKDEIRMLLEKHSLVVPAA